MLNQKDEKIWLDKLEELTGDENIAKQLYIYYTVASSQILAENLGLPIPRLGKLQYTSVVGMEPVVTLDAYDDTNSIVYINEMLSKGKDVKIPDTLLYEHIESLEKAFREYKESYDKI